MQFFLKANFAQSACEVIVGWVDIYRHEYQLHAIFLNNLVHSRAQLTGYLHMRVERLVASKRH